MDPIIAVDHADLERRYGIVFMGRTGPMHYGSIAMDKVLMALDAQPGLVSTPNAGILSLFTTVVEPNVIEVLVRPTKAAELYGERKVGTWVSDTVAFIQAERTGEVGSYGDFSQDAMADANIEFPQRQSYHYQTNTRWGAREVARAAEAKVDLANWKQRGAALAIEKYQNYTYLQGVAGLQNYGGMNDPFLPAPIAPTLNWFEETDPTVIFGDVLRLVQQAIAQGNGLIDTNTTFRMGISPGNNSNFSKTNQFNYNVNDQIKKNFPDLTIVTVPEFALNGGGGMGGTEFIQLIAEIPEGGKTVEAAFTEKMRQHAMVVKTSSWEQKKSAGTWGVVFYRPVLVASMLG